MYPRASSAKLTLGSLKIDLKYANMHSDFLYCFSQTKQYNTEVWIMKHNRKFYLGSFRSANASILCTLKTPPIHGLLSFISNTQVSGNKRMNEIPEYTSVSSL